MDTGNCLLIDSSMYINHKYSFREEVKYEVSLKKKALKEKFTQKWHFFFFSPTES